jgi:hypothetical protein
MIVGFQTLVPQVVSRRIEDVALRLDVAKVGIAGLSPGNYGIDMHHGSEFSQNELIRETGPLR